MPTILTAAPILITHAGTIALLSAAKMIELTLNARGLIASWLREHHITDVDPMRDLYSVVYHFDADQCAADRWRFIQA